MEPSKVFAASLLCLAFIFALSAQTDLNSETGGLSAAFGQAPPPNGEYFLQHPAGRYSDGRLVIDFVAKSLGLPYLSAYLDSVGTNFSHGANFATAGSTIRPQNTTLTQTGYSPISLHVQLLEFDQFKSRSDYFRLRGGVFQELLPKQSYKSRPDILDKFSIVIKNVYWQGGRYFWIHNTGPVGCLSYVLHRLPVLAPQVDNAGCAIPFNQVVQYFNQLLKETVIRLRSDLPDYQLISEAPKYGFGNPLRACCGHGGNYATINWDGVHYTQAVNQWVFEKIIGGTFSNPPTPLSQACHGHKQLEFASLLLVFLL
ncbi:hypothetical protein AMTRI_Chr11g158540 [Amborella trichopoda]